MISQRFFEAAKRTSKKHVSEHVEFFCAKLLLSDEIVFFLSRKHIWASSKNLTDVCKLYLFSTFRCSIHDEDIHTQLITVVKGAT